MGEIGEVNFIPVSHYILITSYIKKEDTNIILPKGHSPSIKEIQQVVAIGPNVKDINIGDWIVLDANRYIRTVKTQSQIKAGIGGQDMIKEELVLPFFMVPGDDTPYLKISSLEISGKIKDYNDLPDKTKECMTMKEFMDSQEKLLNKENKK